MTTIDAPPARLRGPADLTAYRDHPTNWTGYTDPLPVCELVTKPQGLVPSVSAVKRSIPKFLDDWKMAQVFEAAWTHRHAVVNLSEDEARDLILPAADRQAKRAARRGHVVHSAIERIGDGQPLAISLDANADAALYVDSLELYVAEQGHRPIVSEFVIFGQGYGGTVDSVNLIDGRPTIVDYKTRKRGKAATRYVEEAAQIGGYADALYWIVEDENGPRRMAPMVLEGGQIVSIAPDGYRLYDVDLDAAVELWRALLNFHTRLSAPARTLFSAPRGGNVTKADPAPTPEADRPTVPGAIKPAAPVVISSRNRTEFVRDQVIKLGQNTDTLTTLRALWPAGVDGFAGDHQHTDAELDQIIDAVYATEARHQLPFGEPDPAIPPVEIKLRPLPRPEDGDAADQKRVAQINAQYRRLTVAQRRAVDRWAEQATAAGRGFALKENDSTRRAAIVSAAILIAKWDPTDDAAQLILEIELDRHLDGYTVGQLLGSLHQYQAEHVAETVISLDAGTDRLDRLIASIGEPNKPTTDKEPQQ